jgi:adenylosuccinate lyase
MREDLESNPEVIGEAVQTILRREGHEDAYERVKSLSRGQRASLEDFRELFADLDVDESTRAELRALTPDTYTGLASDLVDDLDG